MPKSVSIKGFNLGGLIAMGAIALTDETMVALDNEGNATLVEADQLMTVGEFMQTDAAKHDGETVFVPEGVVTAAVRAERITDVELAGLQIGEPFTSKNNPGVTLVSIAKRASVESLKERFAAKKSAPAAQAAAPAPSDERY